MAIKPLTAIDRAIDNLNRRIEQQYEEQKRQIKIKKNQEYREQSIKFFEDHLRIHFPTAVLLTEEKMIKITDFYHQLKTKNAYKTYYELLQKEDSSAILDFDIEGNVIELIKLTFPEVL